MKPDAMDKMYLAQTIQHLMEAYDKMSEALRSAQSAKNEKLFGMIYAKQWEIAELATTLIAESAKVEQRQVDCDDCGIKTNDLITKGNHHGGHKTVCRDRDACWRRTMSMWGYN